VRKDIKPIETLYRGYRFRSRLEARWAVLFDVARILWRYEEGFDLSDIRVPEESESVGKEVYLLPYYYQRYSRSNSPLPDDLDSMEAGKVGHFFWDLRPPREVLHSRLRADSGRLHSAMRIQRQEASVVKASLANSLDLDELSDAVRREFALGAMRMHRFDPKNPGPMLFTTYNAQWCECPRCKSLGIAQDGDARDLECGCLASPKNLVPNDLVSILEQEPCYTDDAPRLLKAYIAARQARFEHRERAQVYNLQSKLDRIWEVLDSDETEWNSALFTRLPRGGDGRFRTRPQEVLRRAQSAWRGGGECSVGEE